MSGDDTRNYQELTPAQLDQLETESLARFDELRAGELNTDVLAELEQLADTVDAVRAERARRDEETAAHTARAAELEERITAPAPAAPADTPAETPAEPEPAATAQPEPEPATADTPDTPTDTPDGDTTSEVNVTVPDSPAELDIPELVASAAKAATTAAVEAAMKAMAEREHHAPATTRPAAESAPKLNPSMADIAQRAPAVDPAPQRPVLVASADVPGFALGQQLESISDLRRAMHARVRHLPERHGQRIAVANMRKEHRYTVGEVMTPEDMQNVLRHVETAEDMASLVASGGWCAPSEIDYNFFSIVCRDGGLDLPTVGVSRGGIKWPVSPSYGDIVASTGLWSWNETQDTAAVTGTAQSGSKTCVHVPCASFLEARLACDGLCLTAGNLTSEAFPELQDNFLNLLQAGHFHRVNGLRIQQLVAASVAVSGFTGLGAAGGGLVANVLGAIALQAQDYRAKYRMCQDSPLEIVLPLWVRDAMRSDLIRRNGIPVEAYADQQIMTWFDVRNVRVQWVYDWQDSTIGGATPALLWPSIVQFLIYAPGTFVLGEGMSLDLGVIRDSTLNSTNDYTAAWMEECWLIAKRGHESRLVTVNICPDGTTGAADLTACGP